MRPGFAITKHAIDDERAVLAVRGDIDPFTVPQFRQAVAASIEIGCERMSST